MRARQPTWVLPASLRPLNRSAEASDLRHHCCRPHTDCCCCQPAAAAAAATVTPYGATSSLRRNQNCPKPVLRCTSLRHPSLRLPACDRTLVSLKYFCAPCLLRGTNFLCFSQRFSSTPADDLCGIYFSKLTKVGGIGAGPGEGWGPGQVIGQLASLTAQFEATLQPLLSITAFGYFPSLKIHGILQKGRNGIRILSR